MSVVYRPSVVVNFKIKFDEELTVGTTPPAQSVGELVDAPPTGTGVRTAEPLILQRGDKNVSFVMARVPKTLSWEKPGYRQAGKFTATFNYTDLPIDPRTVRSCAIEIHSGTVADKDFAEGMSNSGAARFKSKIQGAPPSILKTRLPNGAPNTDTLRGVYTVDEWKVLHDESGSTVTMSGRDLRGLLIDTQVADNSEGGTGKSLLNSMVDNLDLDQDIQNVVVQILALTPLGAYTTVEVNPAEWPNGVVPSPGGKDLVPRHRQGARKQKPGGRATSGAGDNTKMSFWDVIVQLCFFVGGIPYFAGTVLRIRPATTIYDKLRGPFDPVRNPTPFLNGQLRTIDAVSNTAITPSLRTRRLVYGRDTQSFELNRKFGGEKRPKVVKVISHDGSGPGVGTEKQIIGVWPPQAEPKAEKARKTKVSPNDKIAISEIMTVSKPGLKSVERCEQVAKALYEEIGRGEVGGECVTKNLSSFGGGAADPDLLRLEPGDGIEVLVDTRSLNAGAPLMSTLTELNRSSFEDAVKAIAEKIGDQNLARVIVATSRGSINEVQRFFRVENIKFQWESSGIKISFDYQNYIVIRDQITEASAVPGAVNAVTTPAKVPDTGPSNAPKGSSLRSIA